MFHTLFHLKVENNHKCEEVSGYTISRVLLFTSPESGFRFDLCSMQNSIICAITLHESIAPAGLDTCYLCQPLNPVHSSVIYTCSQHCAAISETSARQHT